MQNTLSAFIVPGIALLVTVGFGAWLGLTGKPYNGALFNIHKLVALGLVILSVIRIRAVPGAMEAPAAPIVIAALCVLALFATGAMMSIGKPDWSGLRVVHAGASILGIAALGLTIYSLAGGKL